MAEFDHGPVELFLVGFPTERPGPTIADAVREVLNTGAVQLLDLLFVTKSPDGIVEIIELEDVAEDFGLADLELEEIGLAGDEDIEEFVDDIEPGTSAALLVIEHVWAKNFASALFASGGRVLHTERVSAPVVNELLASASIDE